MDLHYVNVGPDGTFRESGQHCSTPESVDNIVAHVEQNGIRHICIYLHGGLVDEQAGMASAERFRDVFGGADAHGIGIVWETGWWETLKNNLSDILSTKLFDWLFNKVYEKISGYFGGIGAKGPGDAEMTAAALLADGQLEQAFVAQAKLKTQDVTPRQLNSWRKELETELEFEIEADGQFQDMFVDPEQRTKYFDDPTQSVNDDPQAPQPKAAISWFTVAAKVAGIAWRVVKRFWDGRDHGMRATITEEILREFYLADLVKTLEWDTMKDAARRMWSPNAGLSGTSQHAGAYLIEQLVALKERQPELTVDLVGHSAGAIAICELFRSMTPPERNKLPIRNVIFLAPACTSNQFRTTMLGSQQLFGEFYMFSMPDELERDDPVLAALHASLAWAYPSSLLYVVSGMLEEEVDAPLLGMLRFGSGEPPFDSQELSKIRAYLSAAGKQRLTLSTMDGPDGDLASRATAHGDFSSETTTMTSIQKIVTRSNT